MRGPRLKAVLWFLPACLLPCVASCGGNDPYRLGKTVPVEGQVLYKGKPLAINEGEFGRVWFYPDPGKGNKTPQVAVGDIDADGKFTLATRGNPGVPLGWYKVMIVATEQIDPTQPKRKRQSLVPARYTAVQTSPLVVEVVEQPAAGAYHLRLK